MSRSEGGPRVEPEEGRNAGNRGNTGPLFAAPRCGTRTRAGGRCRAPAVAGRTRCRMHGGGGETGAPLENMNARKSGLHARERRERQRKIAALFRRSWKTMREMG